jgi:hypothetical protein
VPSSSVRRIKREDLLGTGNSSREYIAVTSSACDCHVKVFPQRNGAQSLLRGAISLRGVFVKSLDSSLEFTGKNSNYVGLADASDAETVSRALVGHPTWETDQSNTPEKVINMFRFSPPPSCFQHFRVFVVIFPRQIIVPAASEKGVTTVVKSV